MQPWHFDLALRRFLQNKENNAKVGACYIFPPIGNYTMHQSGCDPQFAKGAGRPNCWRENWCCPGTKMSEDPQKRSKKFMAWDGDKKHFDVGDANVDVNLAGQISWLSFWAGETPRPRLLPADDRRPPKKEKGKKGGGKGPYEVEPAATSEGPGVKKRPAATGGKPSTEALRKAPGFGKGTKAPPFSLWPNRPDGSSGVLARDPVEQFSDDDDDAPTLTKRQRRVLRGTLLMRSFREWVGTAAEAAGQKTVCACV